MGKGNNKNKQPQKHWHAECPKCAKETRAQMALLVGLKKRKALICAECRQEIPVGTVIVRD